MAAESESNSRRTDTAVELSSHVAPVIERAPLPMIEVEGPDHIICFVNSAFCRLLGKKREELLEKPFAEIVCNGAECVPLLNRVYETGEFETHTAIDESDASPTYWLYAMWPALDTNEKPARVIIQLTKAPYSHQNATAMNEALLIAGLHQHELRAEAEKLTAQLQTEVTERKRIEQDLKQAQAEIRAHADKLEQTVAERTAQLRASIGELEAFSYSLAHDLRGPVRAIHGFSEIALEMSRDEVGPAAADVLQRVIKAAIRMDGLIRDVLTLSQVIRQPLEIGPVDVEHLLRDLINERPELSQPLAEITIESPLHRMLGHAATLSQCLTNLLGNAVKFVELGVIPRVRVWSEEIPAAAIRETRAPGITTRVAIPAAGAKVRLWVEDHGIGIAADAHAKIFEMFQRLNSSTKYEGSGIGLAIVRKAIERMGGQVGVESERGKGSRFWLELPKA